ncbi:hypothetical protein EF405_18870 [Cyclobacteriaceae bacterium YHN15]|nr:hypothetical protein EF405_18870 [Cyclobacteriaceae bacterium YHN15]
MAEKVIRNNQSIVPFFGERLSFIRGLDPLGLQNTSDATFSMLLPGLNNVTGRIRYYSFYCWLLDEYSKQIGSTNPKVQQQFIRRAEYIIALASSYFEGDASSIPGSLYASKQISKDLNTVHSLQAGTFQENGSTTDTYWKYPLGAFGQYYFGSLSDVGLVSRRDNEAGIYVRSNSRGSEFISGEALASAFNNNIGSEAKTLFFDCIKKGEITEAQLMALLPNFNLAQVPPKTDEQHYLLSLLLQKDYPLRIEEEPTTHRNATIKFLLEYVKSFAVGFSNRAFIYQCYANKGMVNGEKHLTIMGWYYYQFNEYWHYANTAIFNGTLAYLENTAGPNWQPLKSFLDDVTNQITEELKTLNLIVSEKDPLVSVLSVLKPNEYDFLNACADNQSISRATNWFLLMFSQYLNQRNDLIVLKEYSELNDLGKDGEGTHYFLNEFAAKTAMPISQYIFEYLNKNIIYRHQYVAFRKMRGGTQSTQKFIIEDHHIRYLGNFEAGFTGPRIGNLISYLKDLGAIAANNTITDTGESLLIKLTNADN